MTLIAAITGAQTDTVDLLPADPGAMWTATNSRVDPAVGDGGVTYRWHLEAGQTATLSVRQDHELLPRLRHYDYAGFEFRIAAGSIGDAKFDMLGHVSGPRQYKIHNWQMAVRTTGVGAMPPVPPVCPASMSPASPPPMPATPAAPPLPPLVIPPTPPLVIPPAPPPPLAAPPTPPTPPPICPATAPPEPPTPPLPPVVVLPPSDASLLHAASATVHMSKGNSVFIVSATREGPGRTGSA
jgi:hypothetical protein